MGTQRGSNIESTLIQHRYVNYNNKIMIIITKEKIKYTDDSRYLDFGYLE